MYNILNFVLSQVDTLRMIHSLEEETLTTFTVIAYILMISILLVIGYRVYSYKKLQDDDNE